MGCFLDLERTSGACRLRVRGTLDADSLAPLRNALARALEQPCPRYVLDLQETDFISTVAWGALVQFATAARRSDRPAWVVGMHPPFEDQYELLGLSRFLPKAPRSERAPHWSDI